jgi:hypothetical protein
MNRAPVAWMLLFTIAAALLPSVTIAADPAQDIYAKYADSVVTIITYDECLSPKEQGSGVVISVEKENPDVTKTGSFILTNWHVIFRPGRIVVSTKTGLNVEATICYFDEIADVALLRVRERLKCTAPNPARTEDVGSSVFAIGTPKSLGWTISNGIVSSVRSKKGIELVQFTAPVSEGSSGGPLFDAKGELVGITSFKVRDSENLNFALRTKPETINKLQRYCWQGALPLMINEASWCLGHFEESESWKGSNEKAKSWEAHSTLIANFEKEYSEAPNKDAIAAGEESVDAARFGRRPAHPLNVLKAKLDRSYSERFEDFPEDYEGWAGATNIETDTHALDQLIRVGLKKWPHRREVYSTIFYCYLYFNKTEACMRLIEELARSLPAKDEVNALPSDESYALWDAKLNLEQLVKDLRLFGELIPKDLETGNRLDERLAAVRRTVNVKGWQAISDKSGASKARSKEK